jgi:hypothetical protein
MRTVIPAENIQSMLSASYRIAVHDFSFVLRIGEPSEQLELLHNASGSKSSCFITAFSFGSVRHPSCDAEFEEELLRELRFRRFQSFSGKAIPEDNSCRPENGYLAMGTSIDDALSLCENLGANGVLYAEEDATPFLLLRRNALISTAIDPRPPERLRCGTLAMMLAGAQDGENSEP